MEAIAIAHGFLGASFVLVMPFILYFLFLYWWKAGGRAAFSVRFGLWSLVIFVPYAALTASGMENGGAQGLTVFSVLLFVIFFFVGLIYSYSAWCKVDYGISTNTQ
ncbi:MAG: hypothetical protein COB23_03045 [Methylophaga sp.]|nr:MAG: hypothetical protein COB23_03045 [Methylophaga sp.]